MFEKVVESILVEYVSEWVEGLDAEKMKIALFGGKVEVRELKLKTAALDKFELPLRVKQGTLGRLTLKVPWKRLTKEAVKMVVEDLYLLVVPAHHDELQRQRSRHGPDHAEDSYAMRMRYAKQQEVRVRELFEKSKNEDARRPSDANSEDGAQSPMHGGDTTAAWGYREKILHNILDNVAIEFKNIHVRYEDTTQMLTKRSFAVGLTIESIHANTTNANGHVTFVDRAQSHTPFVHKILEMTRAGLYCDDLGTAQELIASGRRQRPPAESYILHPFNASVKMTVNHDETTMFSIPKFQFVADVGSIIASVTQSQCNELISAINFISIHEIYLKRIHIRKRRPKIPIKRDPRSWWMYALYGVQVLYSLESKHTGIGSSTLSLTGNGPRERCTWRLFTRLWIQRKEYIILHKKMLKVAAKKLPLDSVVTERLRLNELEDELNVETIVFFRLCAEQEFELEENREDSVKKLTWKARWKSKTPDPAASVLRRLDPLEKLVLYSSISEQMNSSSSILVAKEQQRQNSKAILYALDLVVTSFSFSLVEQCYEAPYSTKCFLRFELDEFLFAIFQRTNACTISSSIKSMRMLDFSNAVVGNDGVALPQPLFYLLASSPRHVPHDSPASEVTTDTSSSHETRGVDKFVEITVNSSEDKFALCCGIRPFRFIHNLSIARKLQSYFVIQVDVAPELIENAEEAFASSSTWLNNAVFAKPPPILLSKKSAGDDASVSVPRIVEFSFTLPLVDVFVLSSETSPILEAKLTDLSFKSGNLSDTFSFVIEGLEILFIDGLKARGPDYREAATDSSMSSTQSAVRTSSFYELQDRKHSTVLRKTRLVFSGLKQLKTNRTSRWMMECNAPPVFFTLSSTQYQQVLQASTAWTTSQGSTVSDATRTKNAKTKSQPLVPPAVEFEADDEQFCLCVRIPQIVVVLEGGGGTLGTGNETDDETGIDLVLDLNAINVEAKFSSSAQAIAADLRHLSLFKRINMQARRREGSIRNKVKLKTAEAIAEVVDEGTRISSVSEQPDEPDPAYDPSTGAPSNRLVEIGQKITIVSSCVNPFKAKIRAQQCVVYWDHDLLISLFRSYLWGNSTAKSVPTSVSSSRTSSGDTSASTVGSCNVHLAVVAALKEEVQTPFSIELFVDKWCVFMRPQGTLSPQFVLKLHGRDLRCAASNLLNSYMVVSLNATNGVALESLRQIPQPKGDQMAGYIDPCELIRTDRSFKLVIESPAGYGTLAHRTDAGAFVSIRGSEVEINYVHAHIHVLADHMQKQIIGFFNWVSVQLRPREIKTVSLRTKLELMIENVRLLVPRGPVGNPTEREKRPERMELEVKKLSITSRPYPHDTKVEQLLIRADSIMVASFLVETAREHTDAVASVDEAVARASNEIQRRQQEHAEALAKRQICLLDHLYVDHVSVPIPPKPKKKNKASVGSNSSEFAAKLPKSKRLLEMEDVVKENDNFCGFTRVALIRPDDWMEPTTDSTLQSVQLKPTLSIQTTSQLAVALDQRQLELLACILDENFGRLELNDSVPIIQDSDVGEKLQLDVKIALGDVSVNLLRPGSEKANLDATISERVIVRFGVEDVRLAVQTYSTQRNQIKATSSRSRFWLAEFNTKDSDNMHQFNYGVNMIECGEIFSSSDGESTQCIDITIDQQAPSNHSLPSTYPKEIRVHVDECALLPPSLILATKLVPFLEMQPQFDHFSPSKSGPINVSVTTGVVHIALVQHVPRQASFDQPEHDADFECYEENCERFPLYLVVSGCVVVRYSNADEQLKHVQAFGRKMSVEISSLWPPLKSNAEDGAFVPPSPCATPTYSSSRHSRGVSTTSSKSLRLTKHPLAEYRRILCDDFAVDVDLVDTSHVDGTTKISTSLTHFHSVLCTFDVFMLSRLKTLADYMRVPVELNSESSVYPHQYAKRNLIVNLTLEDVGVTFVREVGEYFTPLARLYLYYAMCNVNQHNTPLQVLPANDHTSQPDTNNGAASETQARELAELTLHFMEDNEGELREDEGLSLWAFNSVLGSWEPIIEPWTLTLNAKVGVEQGVKEINVEVNGSDNHALNVNCSPSLLDTLCAIAKELEPLSRQGGIIPVSNASVISCGFYLANDCGANITYWVSDHSAPSSAMSRGFRYAPRHKRVPEVLVPRHKVPLKLSTGIMSTLPNDQTLSFSWGDEGWHPLTDVRIHSAGKYVYSVLSKSSSRTNSRTSAATVTPPRIMLALFDISTVFGYRTLTVSSLVRVFNDTDVPIDCAVLGDDGATVTDIGMIEPQDACGVPITMIRSLAGIRLLVRPHRLAQIQQNETSTETSGAHCSTPPMWEREHRWSNELLVNDREESVDNSAACSLVLDDYDCRCQRMFDGSQPLHVSQICRSNGSFFRVWNRVFTASNASSLKYAQLRVLPPLTFENKCGVPIYVVVFVFKKVRRVGVPERDYSHIVASERIPARGSLQFMASSLHETTVCSISMTGFSWSKIFHLPSKFPTVNPTANGSDGRSTAGFSNTQSGSTNPPSPSSPQSPRLGNSGDILCAIEDFRSRKASINVILHGGTGENAFRRVLIQPRFVIKNETSLPVKFEPTSKLKSKLPSTKSLFAIPLAASNKSSATCCGSPQLELIHSKLNALHGATTTGAIPRTSSRAGIQDGSTVANAASSDEFESFYCSETNTINIQLEGSMQASSGVAHFRLDTAVGGSNSTIRLYDESQQQWYDIVVILEQVDAYTTKATFVERYVILNRSDHDLICVPACDISSSMQDPQSGMLLKPRELTPYHWGTRSSVPADVSVRVKLNDSNVTGWRWSGRFSLHEVSETSLKLSNKFTSQVHVIRVEVRVQSSVRVFVMVSSEDGAPFPLYRIINSSTHEIIHFKQSFEGASGDMSEQSAASIDFNRGVTQRLFPGESACFGWDEAFYLQSLDRVVHITYAADTPPTKIFLDQPGEAQRIELPATKTRPASSVFVHWYLNGVTKTVHVHDNQLPRDRLTGKLDVINSVDSGRNERRDNGIQPDTKISLRLQLPNMVLSLLNDAPEEILLMSAEKLDFKYANQPGQHDEFELKLGGFQIDNQLPTAVFPVVFTPTPMSTTGFAFLESPKKISTPPAVSASGEKKIDEARHESGGPFFHVSIFRLSYGDGVEYLKYLSAMLQPARLQIDDYLVVSVALLFSDYIRIVQRYYPPDQANSVSATCKASTQREEFAPTSTTMLRIDQIPSVERRMYIETLQLHPIKIQVTFQQNNLSKAAIFEETGGNFLLPVVFLILKSNLVNIDAASLNLNALHIFHSFTTRSFMMSAIQQHYAFQGILQMYALVGAADILGNPLGLVTNLGTGVKDFFYEPMAGMVKSPQEFVMGLSRGTASLVKNSVYGTFNAASKFTGTLSSGIAALSMDTEYIKARNTRNRQEVATHIGTGLLYGTKQLGQGILAGVSGVITAPAMGAYNNGLTGFVEGVGKGLIGVAVKPTAGILDLAAKTTAGITATATVFDKKARDTRIRLPRMMHTSDKRLRVYSNDEAMISQLLHRLPHKLLRNEHYEAHVFLPMSRAVVATSHQIFLVDFSTIAGVAPAHPRVPWKFPLSSLWGAQKNSKGVTVMIGLSTSVSLSASSVSPAASPTAALLNAPQSATVTKNSMTTVLVALRETEAAYADRLVKCVSDLVALKRERAPVSETLSAPLPKNSIGMVLEPVRDSNKIAGYEGYGGRVVDVFMGSACFRAGVEVGDVIVGFGKQKFEAGDHGSALRTQLSMMKKGDALELMVLRHGEIKYIHVVPE